MGNKYFKGSKQSESTSRKLVRCFSDEMSAKDAAQKCGLSERAVSTHFREFRNRIAEHGDPDRQLVEHVQVVIVPLASARLEKSTEESAPSKARILVMTQVGGRVCIDLIPDKTGVSIRASLEKYVHKSATIYTNKHQCFAGVKAWGFKKHVVGKGGLPKLPEQSGDSSATRNYWWFWRKTQSMRKKAFGIPSKFLFDFFKESAFRWSHSSQGIYKPLLRILESHPLIRIYPETKRKFVIPKENPS